MSTDPIPVIRAVAPLLANCDVGVSSRWFSVSATRASLAPILNQLSPAQYALLDIWGALQSPKLSVDVVADALRASGADILPDTIDGRRVVLLRPDEVAQRDAALLQLARARIPSEVAVRALQRLCRRKWSTSWWVRGACERLEERGALVRRGPEVMARAGAVVWQVAGIDVP